MELKYKFCVSMLFCFVFSEVSRNLLNSSESLSQQFQKEGYECAAERLQYRSKEFLRKSVWVSETSLGMGTPL